MILITEGKAEVVGIYIGDGYIYKKENKSQIGFVGNPRTDMELFEKLKSLFLNEWGKEVKLKTRSKGLRIVFRSKEIYNFLINEMGLPFGEGKCEKVKIPEKILEDWNLVKYTIRGIMDTDGTIFVSKKPGIEKYPTMEITTTSPSLAGQLREILLQQSFRVGNIRKSLSKTSKRNAYRVPLYGKENVRKWIDVIGFSNKYKLDRANSYIQ
jgi:hypothetical protein